MTFHYALALCFGFIKVCYMNVCGPTGYTSYLMVNNKKSNLKLHGNCRKYASLCKAWAIHKARMHCYTNKICGDYKGNVKFPFNDEILIPFVHSIVFYQ